MSHTTNTREMLSYEIHTTMQTALRSGCHKRAHESLSPEPTYLRTYPLQLDYPPLKHPQQFEFPCIHSCSFPTYKTVVLLVHSTILASATPWTLSYMKNLAIHGASPRSLNLLRHHTWIICHLLCLGKYALAANISPYLYRPISCLARSGRDQQHIVMFSTDSIERPQVNYSGNVC